VRIDGPVVQPCDCRDRLITAFRATAKGSVSSLEADGEGGCSVVEDEAFSFLFLDAVCTITSLLKAFNVIPVDVHGTVDDFDGHLAKPAVPEVALHFHDAIPGLFQDHWVDIHVLM